MTKEITSFDSARPGEYGDILNIDQDKNGETKVGLLAVGYFEYWRMYPELKAIVEGDLRAISERLEKCVNLVYPGMIDSMDKAERAGRLFLKENVNVIIIVEGTYLPDFIVMQALEQVPNASVILFNTQNGYDVNPSDNYQAIMRNSALIGTTQLSGSFTKSKKIYDVVVGEASDQKCYEQIVQIVRVKSIIRKLRTYNIGLVGHVFRGMFDLEFDKGSVRGILGPEVISIQSDHLIEIWGNISAQRVHNESKLLLARFKTRDIEVDDVERSVRVGIALEELAKQYKLESLCFLGQHYIEKMTEAPARIGASLMLEKGFMVACEGDIAGLIMMKIMYELTGNKPVQLEWGQLDRKNNALLLVGHGIASPCLAQTNEGITLTGAPEEWGFKGNGVNLEMIAKPGEVTLGHFINTPNGWRMLVSQGMSIDFPTLPCNEIHAMIQMKSPVEQFIKELIELGVTHHVVMVHGQCVNELIAVSSGMGIQCKVLI